MGRKKPSACLMCGRVPEVEVYTLYPNQGYLSCCVTFKGHDSDSIAKVVSRWNEGIARADDRLRALNKEGGHHD